VSDEAQARVIAEADALARERFEAEASSRESWGELAEWQRASWRNEVLHDLEARVAELEAGLREVVDYRGGNPSPRVIAAAALNLSLEDVLRVEPAGTELVEDEQRRSKRLADDRAAAMDLLRRLLNSIIYDRVGGEWVFVGDEGTLDDVRAFLGDGEA
jgi:hypothetical protein